MRDGATSTTPRRPASSSVAQVVGVAVRPALPSLPADRIPRAHLVVGDLSDRVGGGLVVPYGRLLRQLSALDDPLVGERPAPAHEQTYARVPLRRLGADPAVGPAARPLQADLVLVVAVHRGRTLLVPVHGGRPCVEAARSTAGRR